ncbi:hypothetical protein BJ875DRAFT_445768 [Amylocarpus encephaloides]|uniref:Uncharacterized protein n=1 Tax=Amylocarpus encephaloides TaxID=45428 RepID=A0A9P7Y9K2_9HELO|nr:hypothetical protein BJ875DRAFT_445768 [Amylocarpus encephaloides]
MHDYLEQRRGWVMFVSPMRHRRVRNIGKTIAHSNIIPQMLSDLDAYYCLTKNPHRRVFNAEDITNRRTRLKQNQKTLPGPKPGVGQYESEQQLFEAEPQLPSFELGNSPWEPREVEDKTSLRVKVESLRAKSESPKERTSPRVKVESGSPERTSPRVKVESESPEITSPRVKVESESLERTSPRVKVESESPEITSPRVKVESESSESTSPRVKIESPPENTSLIVRVEPLQERINPRVKVESESPDPFYENLYDASPAPASSHLQKSNKKEDDQIQKQLSLKLEGDENFTDSSTKEGISPESPKRKADTSDAELKPEKRGMEKVAIEAKYRKIRHIRQPKEENNPLQGQEKS